MVNATDWSECSFVTFLGLIHYLFNEGMVKIKTDSKRDSFIVNDWFHEYGSETIRKYLVYSLLSLENG